MKKTLIRSALVAVSLAFVNTEAAYAQARPAVDTVDATYARPRDLVALQNDLDILDELLATATSNSTSTGNRRSQEFQRRADEIRDDVTLLADQMRAHNDARREGRIEGRFAGGVEVTNLRREIAVLRTDIENAQAMPGRGGRRNRAAYVIPTGTEIQVMIDQKVSSRSANVQDRVTGSTVEAIRLDGRTIIPAGATVSGVVREVRSKSRGQGDGWLKIDFDRITGQGGAPVAIRSQVVALAEADNGTSKKGRNTGIGAILGGVLGAIIDGKKGAVIGAAVGAGGGLLASQGSEDVELDEGTILTLRLDGPVNYAVRR